MGKLSHNIRYEASCNLIQYLPFSTAQCGFDKKTRRKPRRRIPPASYYGASPLRSALRGFPRAMTTNMGITALDVLSDCAVFGLLPLSAEGQVKTVLRHESAIQTARTAFDLL